MKRLCIAALLVALGLGTTGSSAHAIGIMASWWNLNDANEDGFGGGLRQEIPLLPTESDAGARPLRLSLDTRASFIHFSDSDFNVYPLELDALVGLGLLYAGIGAGYYIFDANFENFDVKNTWGWFAVGGVQIETGSVGIFGEVKWTSLTADFDNIDVDLGDIPNSLEADGVGFNAGLMFGI